MRAQTYLLPCLASAPAVAAAFINARDVKDVSSKSQASDMMTAYANAVGALQPAQAAPAGPVEGTQPFDPTPVASAAAADATTGGLHKRGTCSPYPTSPYNVTIDPDTPDAWASYPDFASAANDAATPYGYTLVPGFQDSNASAQANAYQGCTSSLSSYDPSVCSSQCNSIVGCTSFVIYFERDPTVDADDTNCPDPASQTFIKCAFYGIPLSSNEATNTGQYQAQFHVLIAGSNAYTNTPPTPSGFDGPEALGFAAIISPQADNSYMGVQTFPNNPYDPSLCASACTATTQYNAAHAPANSTARACNMFDAYMLYKNDADPIFTCAYYTQSYDASYATNTGQYDDQGDHFTIAFSNVYTAVQQASRRS